ncbi:MAG: fibronectin type III domain-containing protein [Verrucomicrobia bacterium]|nr:fibronectin type III domain-containing protein [Verrucomicrobiota bacterium]MCG2681365.1 fibronectin type III domain-containing protein [Kiritimatiellia bacterium]
MNNYRATGGSAMRNRLFCSGIVAGSLALGLLAGMAWATDIQCDRECDYPSISDDGKIIAFRSCSSNWSGNLNVRGKVFVYHRERHKVLFIGKNGPYTADDDLTNPMISGDGKQVFYESGAENLIGGITDDFYVTNNTCNIFACEIEEGDFSLPAPGFTHKLISMAADGAQANRVSYYSVCSSNGRFVAFQTLADNLDPDTVDTNYDEDYTYWMYTGWDIYLRDRDLDGNGVFDEEGAGKTKTTRASHDSDIGIWHCARYPSISADGKYVAYELSSSVAPLGRGLGVCVYRVADGAVSVYRPHDYTETARISPDGGYLAAQYDPSIYGYYRTIMYALPDTNWWYAAIPMNVSTGICVGNPELGTGGHFTAFCSGNTNFVAGDSNHKEDVFVRVATAGNPRNAESYELASKSTAGEIGNDESGTGLGEHTLDITPDGRFVVFTSMASNLVAVDTNALQDIFIRDRLSNTTEMVVQKGGNPSFPPGAALTVSQIGDTSAFFQWTAATDAYPIWEYQLSLTSAGGTTQITVSGESTSYAATGLESGTEYASELEAYDGGGRYTGNPLTAAFTTTGTAPMGPVITANGQRDTVNLSSGEEVTIAVQMVNIDQYAGVGVDWWIVALARSGQWYYLNSSMQWVPFDGSLALCQPVYQGGLMNLSATAVLSGYILPAGTFDFWFAVDYPMDGVLDINGTILYDQVTVYVE